MNYPMEIRAFYDRLETTPLSPAAIALWHALMYLSDKAGWPEELSIPIGTLEARSRLERRNVYRTRTTLRDAGLIDFRERTGNLCAMYRIVPSMDLRYDDGTRPDMQTDTQRGACGADPAHERTCKPSHGQTEPYENDTQCVVREEGCGTDPTRKPSPLNKENLSSEKKREIGKKWDLSFIGDPAWETLVESWLEYKRSRGEHYKSELSVKKFHTMLRNYSRGDSALARRIIDKSIANNWAGIFEPKESDPPSRSTPAAGRRIGRIKQPEDEQRRRKLLEKFDVKK